MVDYINLDHEEVRMMVEVTLFSDQNALVYYSYSDPVATHLFLVSCYVYQKIKTHGANLIIW